MKRSGREIHSSAMKVQIYCRSFAPAIGGMERLIETLAREFVRRGARVEIATETLEELPLPFPVHRRPGFFEYLAIARNADLILTAPLSLRRLLPQLMAGRRIFISHPMPFDDRPGALLKTGLKRLFSRLAVNVAPSQHMAHFFPSPHVIENPYDDKLFRLSGAVRHRQSILFVGRLVRSKGCHVLIEAFARMAGRSPEAKLTIVGDGEERIALEGLVRDHQLERQVQFTGTLAGSELVDTMNAHQIMVVPSEHEAFGIVVLEGLACGCRMIVARSGGLPEAAGDLALVFERGDIDELAGLLLLALSPEDRPPSATAIAAHLARFTPEAVADRYLNLFRSFA